VPTKIPVNASPIPPAQGGDSGLADRKVSTQRRAWQAYTVAVALPLATLAGRLAMGFRPGDPPMMILFVIPMIVSAYMGGVGPGLVATAVSALVTDYFLLMPPDGVPLLTGLKSTPWQAMVAEGALISLLTEALHLSRQRFHAILDTALDAIVVIDHEGRIVEFNPTAERMFGHTAAAVLGRTMGEVIVPVAMREHHRQGMARYLATGEARILGRRIELTALRADGTEFPVEVSIQRIAGVHPPLFTGFIRDITGHKRAQETVRRSEAILAQAQRIAHIGSWDLDLSNLENLNANPLHWSDELFRIFGYEPGSVVVTNELFFQHVHPDDRDKIKAAVAETLRTGCPYSIDHRITLPDGTGRIIHEQADLIREEKTGRPLRMVGTAQDVTHWKRAEDALRASEERFRQLIENGSDIIAVIDGAGIIRYQSPSTTRLLGYTPEEMTGRPIAEFIHPDDLAKLREFRWRVVTGQEKPTPLEYRFRHRDGAWRILQSFGKRMTEPGGEQMIVTNSRDVTDSRQMEEQFRQSQKMEAIGQLSGGVAHDFNNLLTVIKGHIGLLRIKEQVSPAMAESIQQIDDAANRAARLTRQLLTFSRQEVMQPADHNLNGLVANLSKMLRRLLSENIEMTVEFAPVPLPIRGDEGMVEQVLLNLVVNARDAMSRGGVLRVVTATVDLDEAAAHATPPARPGTFACLTVSDTGTGIAPEIRSHIFEPFFTTKGVGKGTGLGLATVYGIMQQHGGWITMESEVGRGTTFRAYFPRLATSLVETGAAQPAALQGGHETILLVEDEPAVRAVAEVALAGLGYRVFAASSGLVALQVWEEHKHEIELLLTDLIMPDGITGRDLALRLRAGAPKLPVIYMSGYSHEVAGGDFPLEEGMNYLPKPFDLTSLAKQVRASLDRGATTPPFASRSV
jgi:PAS domain S-box-containing protein